MNTQIITLTPPIDGVQYGYNDEQIKEGDWMWNQWKGTFEGCFGIAGKTWHKSMKKVICSTNPKDTRFPYLVMPSKEQEVERLAEQDRISIGWGNDVKNIFISGFTRGFNTNPAKYTQEQMEKAIFQAKLGTQLTVTERYSGEDGVDNLTKDILQSLQPTVKAVRVEMEVTAIYELENRWEYGIKVETSSEFKQGIVRAIEVIN